MCGATVPTDRRGASRAWVGCRAWCRTSARGNRLFGATGFHGFPRFGMVSGWITRLRATAMTAAFQCMPQWRNPSGGCTLNGRHVHPLPSDGRKAAELLHVFRQQPALGIRSERKDRRDGRGIPCSQPALLLVVRVPIGSRRRTGQSTSQNGNERRKICRSSPGRLDAPVSCVRGDRVRRPWRGSAARSAARRRARCIRPRWRYRSGISA